VWLLQHCDVWFRRKQSNAFEMLKSAVENLQQMLALQEKAGMDTSKTILKLLGKRMELDVAISKTVGGSSGRISTETASPLYAPGDSSDEGLAAKAHVVVGSAGSDRDSSFSSDE